MAERTCVACNDPLIYVGRGRLPKFCKVCRPPKGEGPLGPRVSTCSRETCCNLLPPGRGPRKWCSGACYAAGTRKRPTRAPKYFHRHPIDYATCVYCEQLFLVRRRVKPTDRVCKSSDCRAQHNNARARERRVALREAGLPVLTPATLEKHRASNSARRAKTRGAQRVERFTHAEIFERDGWRCGVCGRKAGKKPWPHPLSPTLDHIIPLSEGGEHTRANSRCAHLSCNSSRNNRGGDEQLRLIG